MLYYSLINYLIYLKQITNILLNSLFSPMLNSITKQKINNLRDLLVGKIPNPQGQVQQITLAMIYKFMSDIDDSTNAIFAGKTFFPGEYAQYKWTHLMDSKLSAQERLNLYAEWLEKMNTNSNVPQLFRTIFKQAFLPYRDPQTLDRFLKQIDELQYDHSEDLWDAYEYLLSSLSAAGDAWQFRTPRHIIDFVTAVVQPSLEDKILDPACGTAGFLISAYKYLTHHYSDEIDMAHISENIVGYDISPEMVQLALVNMYLHHFPDPKIHEYDTLTSEERRTEKFDCILANPPFMTPKGGIQPHNKFSVTSNRSEVLFVDYIIEHLRSNGKAGIIVPEGVIFQSANAYKRLRKTLIETGGLWGVISLPAGVFNPYSGVKTSILLIDKSIQTDQIVFAKITADGYDLWAQRREIQKNDLPDVLRDLLTLKSGLKNNEEITDIDNPLIRSVAKTDLADDYNLSAETYKTSAIAYTGNWEMVELWEICEVQNWYAFDSKLFSEYEWFPLIRIRDINSWFWNTKYTGDYSEEYIVNNWDLLIWMDWDFRAKLRSDWSALLNQRTCRVRNFKWVLQKYVYYLIQKELDRIHWITFAVTVKHLSSKQILAIKIPLPPLEIQEQIVKELDGYQAIIDGAKQIVDHRKPTIEIDPEWEMVKLGEVCEINPKKSEILNIDQNIDISFVPMSDLWQDWPSFKSQEIKKLWDVYKWYTYFKDNDVLLAKVTPCFENWKAWIADKLTNWIGFWSSEFVVIRPNDLILSMRIYCLVTSNIFRKNWKECMTGTWGLQRVPTDYIKSYQIPLPSIDIQQSIVDHIQHEQSLVDSAKQLIDIYETKIKERIERVWGE